MMKGKLLKDRSKDLHDILTSDIINSGYIARKISGAEKGTIDAKNAASKLHQKTQGKSAISDEDMWEVYNVLTTELNELAKKLTPKLAHEMARLKNDIFKRDSMIKARKMKGITPEKLIEIEAMLDEHLNKD